MQQPAALAPLGKMFGIAGLLVAATLGLHGGADDSVVHRLRLHAVDNPNAWYATVFTEGDIGVRFHDGKLHPLTFHVRVRMDGCRWMGTEQLFPIDDKTFAYDYSETVLGCAPGVSPTAKTPRVGTVTVEE